MANHRLISLSSLSLLLFFTAAIVAAALLGRAVGRLGGSRNLEVANRVEFSASDPLKQSRTRKALDQALEQVHSLEAQLRKFGEETTGKWRAETTQQVATTAGKGGDFFSVANGVNAKMRQSVANWRVRSPNPELAAKTPTQYQGCSPTALKMNADAVSTLTRFAEGEWRGGEVKDTNWATELLRDATDESPECVVALLNYAIVLFYNGNNEAAMGKIDKARQLEPKNARVVQWKAILLEATGERHLAVYKEAQSIDPELSFRYHGITNTDSTSPMKLFTWQSSLKPTDATTNALMTCMRALLLCKEYCTFGTGDPAVSGDGAALFHSIGGTVMQTLIDPKPLQAVQKYYRTLVEGGYLPLNDTQAIRYYLYNDAVSRFLSTQSTNAVARIVNEPVKPTYTYFTAYVGSADLKPHLDRAQCAFTLTVQIDISPPTAVWGFGFDDRIYNKDDLDSGRVNKGAQQRTDPAHEHVVYLRPGDGGLIRGETTMHFREQLPKDHRSYHVFMHYVPFDFSKSLG